MKDDLDLLVYQMEVEQRYLMSLEKEVKERARAAGQLKAIAMAVRAGEVGERSCDNRYAHRGHLWRDETTSLPHAYRCGGRSTDAT